MLDWNDLRFFLAVARHGSLSTAGFELKVAASTVGRRLSALEASLGVRLLHRTPNGYVLTLAGEEVREKAEHLEADTIDLVRSLGRREEEPSGTVRVTCTESVACHLVAPCLPALHQEFPSIRVELTPDARTLSLAHREADILVRFGPPDQQEVVGRRVGTLAFAAYASAEYLAIQGKPDFTQGCRGHCTISQLGDLQETAQAQWFSKITIEATVAVQTCSHEAALGIAAVNGGIACLARYRAEQDYRLVRLPTSDAPISADLWLVMHKDNRKITRMRAVADHLAEHLRFAH